MRRVVAVALASLLLCSQAAECRALQTNARGETKADADALAAALRLAGTLESDLSTKRLVLIDAARAYSKAGRFDEAVRAASSMDDGWEKALTFSRIADALAGAGNLDRAAALLDESLLTIRRVGEDDFDSTSAYTLHSIVNGAQSLDYEKFPPRQTTAESALARLVDAGRADDAVKVLSLVKSIALDFEMNDEAQAKLFAGAARLYTRAGDVAKARESLEDASTAARRIEGEYEKTIALCDVADACVFASDRKRAELTLAEATQAALPLEQDRDRALRVVVRAYADAKLYEQARAAAHMSSDEEGAHAFAALAALDPESEPADFEAALSGAVDAAVSLEDDRERARALEGLASAYGARSPVALPKITEAASSLRGARSRAEALIAVGDAHSEAGHKEAALEAWRRALQSARALRLSRDDLYPGDSRINDREKLDLLFGLARRFAHAGSHELAREIARDVKEVQARALQLAEGSPAYATETGPRLAELAVVLLREGRRDYALELLEAASRATSKGGDGVDERLRLDSLGAVAAAYAKAGEKARAGQHFRRALEAAQKVELYGDSDALGLLSNIGERYAEAGMKPDAVYLKAMRRLVRKVEKEFE